MRNKKHTLTFITAVGLGLTIGWGLVPQATAQQKQMTDPKEYEVFDAYNKAQQKQDWPTALKNLDAWQSGFPQSAFAEDRENAYLFAYNGAKDIRKTFDKAAEILKTRPNYYYALQFILQYATALTPLQPADLDTSERVSKHILDDSNTIFAVANKPDASLKDEQWAGIKQPVLTAAQRTYAWVFFTRKDWPKAEVEITKFLQMDGTQAGFSYNLGTALLAQNKVNPEKQPAALFHFARAAAYDGQNSLPAAQRKTVLDYVTKTYTTYHCSQTGLPELLAMAKTNVFPPAGFTIKSCAEIDKEKLELEAAEAAKHPMETFWREVIKTPLIQDPGFWMGTVEGALLPGEAGKSKGVDKFKGKLISQTPANKPKQLVLGLEKGDVPDITLVFEDALPGNMEPGSVLEFEGTAKAFTKEPFMLTFEVTKEQLTGWEGKNAPAAKAKQPATKGGTKAAPKGKAK